MHGKKSNIIFNEDNVVYGLNQVGESIAVQVDEIGRVISIDILHDLIHDGKMWFTSHIFRNVPDETTVYLYHKTGLDKALHSQIVADSVGKWLFQSYANSTITVNGTQLIPTNRKSNSTEILTSEFYINPTLSDEGTPRLGRLFGSGTQPSRFTSGELNERLESIFGSEVEVLVGFTNESGSIQDLTVMLDFYETPNF